MLPPWPAALSGRLEQGFFTSELLRGNPLGDPHERPLWVYLPPGAVHFDIVPGADHEAFGRRQVHSLSWLTGKLSGAGR
jgi:hypothetical protein